MVVGLLVELCLWKGKLTRSHPIAAQEERVREGYLALVAMCCRNGSVSHESIFFSLETFSQTLNSTQCVEFIRVSLFSRPKP